LSHQYARALTLALSMQREVPASPYLKETIAKAWYGIAKEKLNGGFDVNEEEWLTDTRSIAILTANLSGYEASVLAIRKLNDCLEENEKNEEITLMRNDLIISLASEEEDFGKKFLRTGTDKPLDSLLYPYTQHAFLNFKNVNGFFQSFDKQVELAKKNVSLKTTKRKRSRQKIEKEKIEKIVIVNPVYKKFDERKKQKVRHIEAENILIDINDLIYNVADKLSVKAEIINPNNPETGKLSMLQSNCILNDWIDEQRRSGSSGTVSPIYNEIVALANFLKTDYFMWTGAVSIASKKRGRIGWLIIGALAPPITPLSVVKLITPRSNTMYYAVIFNVRTQKVEVLDVRYLSMKDNSSVMQSNLYYSLFKLKNGL
jgi:beta-barrel assembly-enhancing protease